MYPTLQVLPTRIGLSLADQRCRDSSIWYRSKVIWGVQAIRQAGKCTRALGSGQLATAFLPFTLFSSPAYPSMRGGTSAFWTPSFHSLTQQDSRIAPKRTLPSTWTITSVEIYPITNWHETARHFQPICVICWLGKRMLCRFTQSVALTTRFEPTCFFMNQRCMICVNVENLFKQMKWGVRHDWRISVSPFLWKPCGVYQGLIHTPLARIVF